MGIPATGMPGSLEPHPQRPFRFRRWLTRATLHWPMERSSLADAGLDEPGGGILDHTGGTHPSAPQPPLGRTMAACRDAGVYRANQFGTLDPSFCRYFLAAAADPQAPPQEGGPLSITWLTAGSSAPTLSSMPSYGYLHGAACSRHFLHRSKHVPSPVPACAFQTSRCCRQ